MKPHPGVFLAFLLSATLSAALANPETPASPASAATTPTAGRIHWQPWGETAFAQAKRELKPVYLFIGAATSELSRAMTRQSFSNAETAAYLNDNFVCIRVDANERPDVFALYQTYAQAVKQVSGPPLNMWLTAELKPFEGSNYLPPTEEWGKEGIVTTMKRVQTAWKADPAAQQRKADEAVATVKDARPAAAPPAVTEPAIQALLKTAIEATRARFDAAHGGFGDAPKYIEPELLRFLLRDADTREMAVTTLRAVLASPVRDPLDGGFFRYASDSEWRQPYFQKFLSDQPRVALALLEAAALTHDGRFADAARDALNYALRLRTAGGDYASAEDATGDELPGIYLWTPAEIRSVLGEKEGDEFCAAYGVTAEGNLPEDAIPGVVTKGKNLLRRAAPAGEPAVEKRLAESAAKLLHARQQRSAPRRDEGAASAAHGLMLSALSRAAQQLNEASLLEAAKQEFDFISGRLRSGPAKALVHLAGQDIAAAPIDYALVIDGLLTYASTDHQAGAEKLATALLEEMNARYRDAKTGRYYTSTADAGTGFWARVYSPAPRAGDLPLPEPALLAALTAHSASGNANAELISMLQRIAAMDLQNAAEVPPADALLALRPAP